MKSGKRLDIKQIEVVGNSFGNFKRKLKKYNLMYSEKPKDCFKSRDNFNDEDLKDYIENNRRVTKYPG